MSMGTPFLFQIAVLVSQIFNGEILNENLLSLFISEELP